MHYKYFNKISLFLSVLLIFQFILPSLPVSAEGNVVKLSGFVKGSKTLSLEREAIIVLADDGEEYALIVDTLQSPPSDLTMFNRSRVYFEGNTIDIPNPQWFEKYLTAVELSQLNIVEPNNDSGLEYISGNGTFGNLFSSKNEDDIFIWNYTHEDGNFYQAIFYPYFSDEKTLENINLAHLNATIEGYVIKSSGQLMIYTVEKNTGGSDDDNPPDNDNPPDEDNNLQTSEFKMNLINRIEVKDNQIIYEGISLKELGVDTTVHIIFDKEFIEYGFPTINLQGEDIILNGSYEALIEGDISKIYVKNWKFFNKDKNYFQTIGEITEVKMETNDFIIYGIKPLDGGVVETVKFEKITLGGNYPFESLLGKQLQIEGIPLTADMKSINVTKWIETSGGGKEDEQIEENIIPTTYYGTLTKYLNHEVDEYGNYIISNYIFTDFNGVEYVVNFDRDIISEVPKRDWEGVKLTISALDKGKDGFKSILQVVNFNRESDDFNYYDKEVISLAGTLKEVIHSNDGERITYTFVGDNQRLYYAVFDKTVLGNKYPTDVLTNIELELFGTTYKDNDIHYIGVMDYRNHLSTTEYGEESVYDGFKSQILEGIITHIISEDESNIVYQFVTEDGFGHYVVFSKDILGENNPNYYLIGKQIKINTVYKLNDDNILRDDTLFVVLSWEDIEENKFKTDKGVFKDLIQKFDTAKVYNFQSVNGRIYKVLVSDEIDQKIDKLDRKIEGLSASIYGYEREWKGERMFVLYGINELAKGYLNEKTAANITFQGTVKEIAQEDFSGITYYASNQYGQYALLYFEQNELKDKFPERNSLLNKEIVVQGFAYNNGVILVKTYSLKNIPKEYPNPLKPLYELPEYFPNLNGFTGQLSVLSIDEPHLVLITSTDTYILKGKEKVLNEIENNLGKIVYLRGEYREALNPYWTGEIEVYDISPTKHKFNIIIKPDSKPLPDIIEDPYKEAVDTIQLPTETPKDYPYGEGIPEALFIPKFTENK